MSSALLLTISILAAAGSQGASRDPVPQIHADFPPQDLSLAWYLRDGLTKQLARERVASAPDELDTIRIVGRTRDNDALLRALRRVVDSHPERLADALEAARDGWSNFRGGDERARRQQEMLRELIADGRTKLAALPREVAARAERAFINMEGEVVSGRRDWPAAFRRFITQYDGTEAALLTEVDLIGATRISQQQFDDLEAFARAHPRTAAAAKALYLEAFNRQYNWSARSDPEPRGADPTGRFLRVYAIGQELESGRYPPCEWVQKVRDVVLHFSIYPPDTKIPVESVDRLLDIYTPYVEAHFALDEASPDQNGIGYFITRALADLYDRKGDRVGGMERFFDRLESRVDSPAAVRYLRAMFYRRPADSPSKDLLEATRGKATATLEALARDGNTIWSRKALAALAMDDFIERRYDAALVRLRSYVAKYPQSDWAWVASIRIGQAEEGQNNGAAAQTEYLRAAESFARLPLPRVLGHEYAARAMEINGQLPQSLAEHQRAFDGWDDAYGMKYGMHTAPPAGTDPFGRPADTTEVDKGALAARIARLKVSLATQGGAQLEHGRALLERNQYEAAASALDEAVRRYPRSPVAADARSLAHRARLERAIALADRERPDADRGAALAALDTLAREPVDFPVTAARIARASLLWTDGARDEAERMLRDALTAYDAIQKPTTLDTPLERDVAAIRAATFMPQGGGVYGANRWNAFNWPGELPPFLVVKSDLTVKLPGGQVTHVDVVQALPGIEHALFLKADEIALLERMVSALGGRKRRMPGAIMETPNQPVGASMEILQLWNKFFPGRPGHWGGWELETYPIITQIEFTNAERTHAAASVTVGYSGGVVELEKEAGVWVAKRLTNQWIT